jgi:hypothetical protein
MAKIIIKEPNKKLSHFIEYLYKQLDVDGSNYSLAIVTDNALPVVKYRFGISNISQLANSIQKLYTRASYVVIYESQRLKPDASNKYMAPFVMDAATFCPLSDDFRNPLMFVLSEEINENDLQTDHMLTSLKVNELRKTFHKDKLNKCLEELDEHFVSYLSSYFDQGLIILLSKVYGIKFINKELMSEPINGIFIYEIFETMIASNLPKHLYSVPVSLSATISSTNIEKYIDEEEDRVYTEYEELATDYRKAVGADDDNEEEEEEEKKVDESITGGSSESESTHTERKTFVIDLFPTIQTGDILEVPLDIAIGGDEPLFTELYKVTSVTEEKVNAMKVFAINGVKMFTIGELKKCKHYKVSYE